MRFLESLRLYLLQFLYWPDFRQDVELYVHRCDSRTAQKGATQSYLAPLQQCHGVCGCRHPGSLSHHGPGKSLRHCGHGLLHYQSTVTTDQSTVTTTERLVSEMFCHFSVPEEPHSDHGWIFKTGSASSGLLCIWPSRPRACVMCRGLVGFRML